MKINSKILSVFVPLLMGSLAGTTHAAVFSYDAALSGPAEAPPNASPGTGYALVEYNDVLHTLLVHADFTGLIGTTSASHIHGATAVPGTGTAGVMTATPSFPGFPLGVTAGTFDNVFDLTLASSWNASFITASGGTPATAEAAFVAALGANRTYFNIHSSAFPGGEIRGFLQPVPEPSSMALIGLGSLALIAIKRRKQ